MHSYSTAARALSHSCHTRGLVPCCIRCCSLTGISYSSPTLPRQLASCCSARPQMLRAAQAHHHPCPPPPPPCIFSNDPLPITIMTIEFFTNLLTMVLFHAHARTRLPLSAPACGPRCTNGTAQLGLAGRKCYRLLSPCLLSVFMLSSTAPPCINSLFRILLMSVPGTTMEQSPTHE